MSQILGLLIFDKGHKTKTKVTVIPILKKMKLSKEYGIFTLK